METVHNNRQLWTPEGSTNETTNAQLLVGPLQGRSGELCGCLFPRVENPWLCRVSPFGALAGHHLDLAGCFLPIPAVFSKRIRHMLRVQPGNEKFPVRQAFQPLTQRGLNT